MIRIKICLTLNVNSFRCITETIIFFMIFFFFFDNVFIFSPGFTSPSRSGESQRRRGCCWLIRPTRPLSQVISPSTKNWLWRWPPCSLRSQLMKEDNIPKKCICNALSMCLLSQVNLSAQCKLSLTGDANFPQAWGWVMEWTSVQGVFHQVK